MNVPSLRLRASHGVLLALACSAGASANVGVFSGSGHTVKLTESAEIQMVKERVEIYPHRGPRLFAGSLPLDQVDFDCTFELRNLSDSPVKVQVGFPLNSQFLSKPYGPRPESDAAELVHEYDFIARDQDRTYHTSFQPFTDEFGSTFLWSMEFAPGETRNLRVSYSMPMSMTLGAFTRGEDRETLNENMRVAKEAIKALPWLEQQPGALLEFFEYVTATGASWAGSIEHAEFIIHSRQFEEYLAARPPMELSPLERAAMVDAQPSALFGPHATRFVREIEPKGYATKTLEDRPEVQRSVRWTHAPFEAGEPIECRYFKSVMPSTPEGAQALFKQLTEEHGADAALVRQYISAWMGIEPTDETLRSFCVTQRWYEPVEGRQEADLSATDRSILGALR